MIDVAIGTATYPQGDGAMGCKACGGRGVVEMPPEQRPRGMITPATVPCQCVLLRDRLRNMERAWPQLSLARPVTKTPLSGLIHRNVWITSPLVSMREHLHRVALGQSPRWLLSVASDADLMTAWLGSIAVKGAEILDADAKVSARFMALVDLVEPPDLLVIHLGVKAARNSAMPEVLLEAVQHRMQRGRPTWLFDQPSMPLAFGHLAYSHGLAELLSDGWERITLAPPAASPVAAPRVVVPQPAALPPAAAWTPPTDPVDEVPPDSDPMRHLSRAMSAHGKSSGKGAKFNRQGGRR